LWILLIGGIEEVLKTKGMAGCQNAGSKTAHP
jgi:hypothetical protein